MALYGLIGFPLTHSFSKKYFTDKFEQEGIKEHSYTLFPIERIDDLKELLASFDDLKGLNVTIPYKEQVLPFLDEIDEEARRVGAVNTIKIEEGKLIGYNTDIYGFETSLTTFISSRKEKKNLKALILGTGGAAKAVAFILEKLGIKYFFVSREKKNNSFTYEELDDTIVEAFQLIVNTTPLGMHPNSDTCPNLPYSFLTNKHYLYDLVYNPELSTFLGKGKEKGAAILNGLEMLHLQAEKSWDIWKNSNNF